MRIFLFFNILCCFFACLRPPRPTPPPSTHTDTPDPVRMLLHPADTAPPDHLTPAEIALLRDGDIILRKGYGAVSDFIAAYLNEDFPVTHCAFLLRQGYATPHVLHTIANDRSDGIFTEPLADYIAQSQRGSLAVVRLKGSDEQRQTVRSEALRLLAKGVPFDMSFDDADTARMYCAEMMRYIFLTAYQQDLLHRRNRKYGLDVIQMDNFFDPQYFEVVLNHHTPPPH